MNGIRSGFLLSNLSSPFSSFLREKPETENRDQTLDCSGNDNGKSWENTNNDSISDLDDLWTEDQDQCEDRLISNITIQVLEGFVYRDPMITLNEFYQQKLRVNPKDFFKDEPARKIDGRDFFGFSFRCPITEILYFSSLPIPIFQEEKHDKVVDLTKKIFGEFQIQRHQVVFSGKKFAKRAVAVAVLEAHSLLGVETKGKKIFTHRPDQSAQIGLDTADNSLPALSPTNGSRKIPSWVHEIHAIGVRADGFSIAYREKLGNHLSRIGEPTTLCCILNIQEPIAVKVVGYPSPTKRDALESAITLLVDEVGRQTVDTKLKPSTPRQAQVEKERLLACNPALVSYITHSSNWTTSPLPGISTKNDVDSGGQSSLFLYTLQFFDHKGHNLVTARTGLIEPTLLGVLFCDEIPASVSGTFEANFTIKQKGSAELEHVLVRLSNGRRLSANEGARTSLITKERMQHLIHFNREIQDWKRYGLRSATELDNTELVLGGRTYMFAPLVSNDSRPCFFDVDWSLLRDIDAQILKPYIKAFDAHWKLPLSVTIDFLKISYLCSILSLMALSLALSRLPASMPAHMSIERLPGLLIDAWNHALDRRLEELILDMGQILVEAHLALDSFCRGVVSTLKEETSNWKVCAFILLLTLSLITHQFYFLLPPFCNFTDDELANRFLTHRFKYPTGKLFVTRSHSFRSKRMIGSSRCRITPCDEEYKDHCKKKWNYDPNNVTFVERSLKRDGNRIRYARMPLLQLFKVTKVSLHDTLIEKAFDGHYENVFPESVMVHPMPKDVLYLLRHETSFMQALELEIESTTCVRQLTEISMHTSIPLMKLPGIPASRPIGKSISLTRLVEEACTVSPKERYQRIEFLGDSVLGYFIALNLMARNFSLKWDFNELSIILSGAGNNSVLYDAALRVGINRMLRHDRQSWKSAFGTLAVTDTKRDGSTLESALVMGASSQNHEVWDVRDKPMADVAESLLGVAYLHGHHSSEASRSQLIIALLNAYLLPLPRDSIKTEGWPWFRAMGSCLVSGYPFGLDKVWQKQLVAIGTALYTAKDAISKLEQGYIDLVAKLVTLSGQLPLDNILNVQSSKILLLCAIFDDSLNDDSDSASSIRSLSKVSTLGSVGTDENASFATALENGLFRAGMMRDTLTLVGAYALQLCITHQVFERNPSIQPKGLHVLRALALTDDCVSYVFMKAGFDAFLYDQQAPALMRFKTEMALSDSIGRKKWDAKGGWIVFGGKKEFTKRWTLPSTCTVPEPQYMGIGGGRLYSHPKGKLPESITGDLVFSFKSIIGALVLSIGVDGMWQCIGPIFEELLLLSFDEVNREYSFSSIIKKSG
jgi:dsRNA-specific ribonuclease